MPATSNTSGFSIGLNLNGSAVRAPDDVTEKGGGLGLRLSYGLNRTVAVYLGIDVAARRTKQPDYATAYGMGHADLGLRFSLADSTSA